MAKQNLPLADLNEVQSIQALALVAEEWLEHEGKEAFSAYRQVVRSANEQQIAIPDWAEDDPEPNDEAVRACRVALERLINSQEPSVRAWAQSAVQKMQVAQPQALDPLTLSVGGVVLVGLVLAARVKSVGPKGADFYKGLPSGIAEIFKSLFGKS